MKISTKRLISPLLAALFLLPVVSLASIISGSLVQTPNGPRAIETLTVGELVLAYDQDRNTITAQPITFLFVSVANDVMRIEVANADGQVISIAATQEHPFYAGRENAAGKLEYRWRPARSLNSGDVLFTDARAWVYVTQVKESGLNQRVFNIEVAQQHNYFVSDYKVLVHNPEEECRPSELLKEFDRELKVLAPNRRLQSESRYRRILDEFDGDTITQALDRHRMFTQNRIFSTDYLSLNNIPKGGAIYADCGQQCVLLGKFLFRKKIPGILSRYYHIVAWDSARRFNHQFALFFKHQTNAMSSLSSIRYEVSTEHMSKWLDEVSGSDKFAIFNPWANSKARVFEGDFKPSWAIRAILDEYYSAAVVPQKHIKIPPLTEMGFKYHGHKYFVSD